MINTLKDNEYFVFGSNLAGFHGGGAAKYAVEHFEAEENVGEGITGKCYAFPTLDENLQKRSHEDLLESCYRFFKTARENTDKIFLMTAVGTGIANYSREYMIDLFANPPANVVLPEEWR